MKFDGRNCAHCEEPLVEGDEIMPFNGGTVLMHRNCGLRGIIGSLAHLQGRCSCFVPGSQETDPPSLTARQAADAAVAEWKRLETLRRSVGASPIPKCAGNGAHQ
jgi:hypothetical protein